MLDVQKKKLSWQCRRGMLELDLLLQAFLEKRLDSLSDSEIHLFESLLNQSDPQLFAWLMGHELAPEEYKELVACIRNDN